MAINKSFPMRFSPKGLVDAFDSTDKFPGACQKLVNLIFDQSNPELVLSRPGVTTLVDFALHGFASPGFISIQAAVGSRVYGMIATNLTPGFDQPFCFETATGAFVPISGVNSGNVPASPSTAGTWTPPTLANIGTMIVITHPGFSGSGVNFFGVIDITNPAAPAWTAANTVTNALPAVPVAVANFNNRAYFATAGNQLWYTDVLTNPLTVTNATQFLVIGDSGPINALSGLPLQTTSSGVIQSLTVFKSTQVWQVTGDTTTFNLSLNYVSLTIGTNAPRSVAQSPYGLYFGSSGGPYFIDLLGTLRPLTHSLQELEPDVQAPFENAVNPTRWAAAYNSTVYRVCGSTIIRGRQSTNDYWFDEHRRRWNGPHTFQYDCASALGGYFVLSSAFVPGQLVQSWTQHNPAFVASDLGTATFATLLSSTFPKADPMSMKQVAESQIELAASGGDITYTLTAQDEQGNTLETATMTVVGETGNLWGPTPVGSGLLWGAPVTLWGNVSDGGSGALWGDACRFWTAAAGSGALWGEGAQNIPHTYPVPWPAPLVFEKMQLQVTAQASAQVSIGTFYARYQRTGYMTLGQFAEPAPCTT